MMFQRLAGMAAVAAAVLTAVPALASEPASLMPRQVSDARIMLIGYSVPGVCAYTTCGANLVSTLIANAVSPAVNTVEIIDKTLGGSVAAQENGGNAGNSWCVYNGGAPAAGALLTAALGEIAARLSVSPTHPTIDPPTGFVVGLGGIDAGVYVAQGAIVATRYTACMKYIADQLESALGGSGPVPIYLQTPGRFDSESPAVASGLEAIKEEHYTSLNGYANVVALPEYYDFGMFNNGHPDLNWQRSWGERMAARIAKNQYGGTANQTLGPAVSTCTAGGSTISVTFGLEAGDTLSKPGSALGPWGFQFFDGTTPLVATWLGWSGNTARWNAGGSVGSLHCDYVYDWGLGFDPARVIKGGTSGLPLRQSRF